MKVRTGLLMMVVATGSLWAQSAPAAAPAAGGAQTQAQAPAKPAAANTAAKPAKKKSSKKSVAPAPSGNVATNVAAAPKHAAAPGKRDPFVSPIRQNSNEPVNCGTGKRCLVVEQTVLQGIVKAPNGMIAVVSNPANKAYFLRENDPVYNGFVMRITPDSVVFREQVTDKLGKKYTREIVKKVNAPVV
jgi:Tfp pilus assembly protein PilP